jgi:hypothetical protein
MAFYFPAKKLSFIFLASLTFSLPLQPTAFAESGCKYKTLFSAYPNFLPFVCEVFFKKLKFRRIKNNQKKSFHSESNFLNLNSLANNFVSQLYH